MSPHDDALTLREYDATEGEVKVELDMLKLAEHILKSKVADFDQSQFVDHHEEAWSRCSNRSRQFCRYRPSKPRR